MKFKVVILEINGSGHSKMTLPFPPTVGLRLKIPHLKFDYRKLTQVYWDQHRKQFEVYID